MFERIKLAKFEEQISGHFYMKWVFSFVLIFHGLIHTLGFLRAYQLAEINQFTHNISKPFGVLWLLTFLLLILAAIQFISNNHFWWAAAFLGVILSQILIIAFWQDAKFGTIPNFIILLVTIVTFADWNFNREINYEIAEMFAQNQQTKIQMLTEEMVIELPTSVQKWLRNSGVVGKEMIHSVRLRQKGEMKMKPEQKNWYAANAEQYFTIDEPAFIWKVKVNMMPLVFFTGRDLFVDGKGRMLIKVFSLFNVVNAADKKMDQSALQRYLGEIIWFPTAAISQNIKWEEVDSLTAKATMTYNGTTGSATFYFNENGNIEKFSAMRYMGSGEEAAIKEWVITLNEYKTTNGIKMPTKGEATWKLETGDFTWYKL